jgi:hypothetical protein
MPLPGSAFSATAEDAPPLEGVVDCDAGRSGLHAATNTASKTTTIPALILVPDKIVALFIIEVFSGSKLVPAGQMIYD